MNHHDLMYLADLNLAESLREIARWRITSEIIEKEDVLFVAGGDNTPMTNSVIRLADQASPSADEVLAQARDFFEKKKVGYSVHIRRHSDTDLEDLCRSQKMALISEAPGMVIQEPVRISALPAGAMIIPVEKPSGAADFAAVVIDSYQSLGLAKETAAFMFETPERVLRPYNYCVVAYLDEKTVSAAMIILSHSIAGVYWVGTLEGARKKGLGQACTAMVTNEAFRRGAAAVILQASQFGEPIYRRLGFHEFTRYPWYMRFYRG
ncbi:MAG: GNAT family N-acetyltransferase [Thermodesulfobacteriota bacterium]